jgi:hypothetical protein
MRKWRALFILLILAGCVASDALVVLARPSRGRQYYSSWRHYKDRGYYYRSYNYTENADDDDDSYQYQYVIYYPSRPRYFYYYNPRSRKYWGRYDREAKGNDCYSILAEKDRSAELKEIEESAFPKPAAMPVIPGAKDGVRMEQPPKDLPDDEKGLPKDVPNG